MHHQVRLRALLRRTKIVGCKLRQSINEAHQSSGRSSIIRVLLSRFLTDLFPRTLRFRPPPIPLLALWHDHHQHAPSSARPPAEDQHAPLDDKMAAPVPPDEQAARREELELPLRSSQQAYGSTIPKSSAAKATTLYGPQWVPLRDEAPAFRDYTGGHSTNSASASPPYSFRHHLRVVSWNILADGPRAALSSVHDYCPMRLRVWREGDNGSRSGSECAPAGGRFFRIVEVLRSCDADVLCLQECEPAAFLELCEALGNEYSGYHVADWLEGGAQGRGSSQQETDRRDGDEKPNINASGIDSSESDGSTPASAEASKNRNQPIGSDDGGKNSGRGGLHRRYPLSRPESLDNAIFVRRNGAGGGERGKRIEVVGEPRSVIFRDRLEDGRHTGKNRKRLATLEESCLCIRLRVHDSVSAVETRELGTPPASGETSEVSPDAGGVPCGASTRASVPVVLTNTHLYWDPKFPQSKASQCEILGKIIKEEVEDWITTTATKEPHQILAGDFNSIPHFQPQFCSTEQLELLEPGLLEEGSLMRSGVYELLTGGGLSPEHPEHPDSFGRGAADPKQKKKPPTMGSLAGAAWTDVYDTSTIISSRSRSYKSVPTTNVPTFAGRIDYLFCRSGGGVGGHLSPVSLLHVPDDVVEGGSLGLGGLGEDEEKAVSGEVEEEVRREGLNPRAEDDPRANAHFPNERLPSDHLPVGADFCFE